MSTATVQVETRGAVAVVTLNRPESANTLNLQMGMDLLAAALSCARSPAVRAVVLTGAGHNFCFGGDLRAMATRAEAIDDYVRELTTYMHAAISHFTRMDAPVIAAVNGTAAGAGVGLAAMADLAVCGGGARFNLAYTNVGLSPDGATSWLLPRLVGVRRSMELLLLNRTLDAQEALAWGLVNEVAADDELLTRALEIAQRLADGPRGAYGATKRLVAHSLGAMESQMTLEGETIAARTRSAEAREGVRAFVEKRAPRFRDC
ncbi:MAG: enoyl-CoA hydratase/isomerase family protein [Proteobacteria bacterium]|nr:enoyl-CoA hydratase/isomerase family protein [Pseudomonadota bacterium]